jgi:ferredoxin
MIGVSVDLTICENHGQCVLAAPEVFAFDDDEQLVYDASPPAGLEDKLRAAAAACPVRAITLTGDR